MQNKDKLIEIVIRDCPFCDKEHKIEKRERITKMQIKDEIVSYKETYFLCTETDEEENEFVSGPMMDENLLRAKDTYRKQKELLTSSQIKEIRKNIC